MIFGKSKEGKNYKFKSLQSYAWDRAMGNKRKFRRVFNKNEINYLSTELAFYNKLFDEDDWKAKINIRAFKMKNDVPDAEICGKEVDIPVSKADNIITYNFGWGDDEYGKFWKQGHYRWVAVIDGEEVGYTDFFVEDYNRVTDKSNPYFEAITLRTYEADSDDIPENQRRYLKTFNESDTRYIMGELRFINHIDTEWLCELFFRYVDDTGQTVGVADTMTNIVSDHGIGEVFTITAGWGANDKGTWIQDNYRLEVIFMDTTIGVIPFAVGSVNIERLSDYEALLNEEVNQWYDSTKVKPDPVAEPAPVVDEEDHSDNNSDENTEEEKESKSTGHLVVDNRPLNEIMDELNGLIGLENIKLKVREYIDYVSFLQYRKEQGFEEEEKISLHSVFTGNPGTGKTTVVKLLGQIFHSMGLLSKGHVHVVDANNLISGYVRQTGKDTKEAIEKARGGILFIDEAYMLFKEGSSGDFGPEAVSTLITEMSDGPGDIAVMVAGYPKEMETMIGSNPGLKSRFKHYFNFEDYTPEELMAIARYAANKKRVTLSVKAEAELLKLLTNAYRKRDITFGNARFATALIDEAKMNLGIRVVKNFKENQLNKKVLSEIQDVDIEDITETAIEKQLKLKIDEDLLKEALNELNKLTGLENIKQEVNELVKLTRYYIEMNRDVLNAFSMHSVFTGNPGTGKTTVARILGKIYKSLGLLERGHFIDADGSSLVAGYLGQTALKTKELVNSAMGGILFIDEAYSLTDGHSNDFGKKAVSALIKEMEDNRRGFGVIVAGYTKNMQQFLESNPGLESRFDHKFHFNDFNEKELWTIVRSNFEHRGLVINKEAETHLREYISHLYKSRDMFFGNARSMRKIVEKAVRNQEIRMAEMLKSERTKEMMSTVVLSDVAEFVPQVKNERPVLGFRIS
ncbi:MAG: AAA family ATPase [Bacteroidales bacterium]|nr:AAA family ATPase [Bacteroidales bacterium]